jgi:hypothetical protein
LRSASRGGRILTQVNDDLHHIKEDYTMSSKNRTPGDEPPESSTAVAEPAADNAGGDQRSFAERVGRKRSVSAIDPFEVAVDVAAGVRLFESKRDRQVAIKFGDGRPEDKPSPEIIGTLKQAGFRWNRNDRIWALPLTPDSSMSTRIEAERLYQQIRGMIRQEKGIESGPETPF